MKKEDIENFQVYLNSFMTVLKNFNRTHSLVIDDNFKMPWRNEYDNIPLTTNKTKKKEVTNINKSIENYTRNNKTNTNTNNSKNLTNIKNNNVKLNKNSTLLQVKNKVETIKSTNKSSNETKTINLNIQNLKKHLNHQAN